MKKLKTSLTLLFLFTTIMMYGKNIFSEPFKTTNGAIPFDKITVADYEPAFIAAVEEQKAEINAICNNKELPTFENTILALENSGAMLSRVMGVFDAVSEADSNDELIEVSNKITPLISEHSTDILLNEALWKRIKYVNEHCDKTALDSESLMLLNKTYTRFFSNGAALEGDKRNEYKQLQARLAQLTLKFGQNCLKDQNIYKRWLTEADIAGLPESAVDAARMAAAQNGQADKYLITLDAPSYMAFLKYADRRDLRENIYRAYNSLNTKGEYSNLDIIAEIANTRLKIANILGFKTFADYKLQNTMAGSTEAVYNLLDNLRDSYRKAKDQEIKELTDFAKKLSGDKKFKLEPWDYSYYSNKLKDSKFDIDDEAVRPYFELNNVIDGVFGFATRMYGVKFVENHDAQVYHPEVMVYNVTSAQGEFLGMLYCDFFPRASKRSGAWMTDFASQYRNEQGKNIRPLVNIVMNFTRPTDSKPSLLTYYEVETFLHEFGHALHSLLTQCRYASLSGTSVYRDFVELPSQFNENYLSQKEFLDSFAKHYITGETIPAELVEKIIASSQFGAAYSCFRQLSFGYTDMAWHTITEPLTTDVFTMEAQAVKQVEIFAPVEGCCASSHFSHIFAGGYAAGYYGYKWAEVLDADAFAKFLEDGIFNQDSARSFYENILQRGGTESPMTLYKRFRGSEPTVDALLVRDGIKPRK